MVAGPPFTVAKTSPAPHFSPVTITRRVLPFAVLVCALLWGSAFPGIKAIYAAWSEIDVAPTLSNRLLLAGVRFAIAGVALLIISRHPWRQLAGTPKFPLFAFACTQTFVQYILFYWGLAVSSAVLGSLLIASGSFWWLLLAPLLLRTPWPRKSQWLLLGLGAAGVIFAVYRPGAGSGNPVFGAILFCTSTLSGAFGLIVLQKVCKTMGARAATGFSLLTGGLMLCLAGVAAWPELLTLFPPKIIGLTLYLALVSAAGFSIWNHLTQLFPVNLLAGYRFLIPVCAVLLSSLLVPGESPGLGIIIGGAMVLTAIIGLQRHRPASNNQ